MKKFVLFIIVLILAVSGYYYKVRPAKGLTEEKAPETVKVTKGSIKKAVSTTGKVTSNRDIEIKCKASGEIINLPFNISDRVKKGDLLLEIDPIDEQRNVKQAEITLSSSQARLAQSKQNLEVAEKTVLVEKDRANSNLKSAEAKFKDEKSKSGRMNELLKKKLISQEEFDAASTAAIQAEVALENAKIQLDDVKIQELQLVVKREEVKLSEAQVSKDQINLAINQRRLDETKIYAPIDSVVADRAVQIGQIIASGVSNVGGGTTTMTLCDLSQIFILASVDESDIGEINVAQTTSITADAYPNKTFTGKVISIATKGKNVSNVVTFEVKIEVVSDNKILLKPEMTTNVDIIAASKEETLLVPVEAVVSKGRKEFVFVAGENKALVERPVKPASMTIP